MIGLAPTATACDGAWLLGHDELRPGARADDDARDRRRGRPVPALDQPARRAGRRHRARPPGRRGDPGHGVRPVPPHRPGRRRACLPGVRGRPRRGAHLLVGEHGERFVDELAGRDVVARAIQQRLDEGADQLPRPAPPRRRGDPHPVPEPGRRRGRRGPRPDGRPDPGGAGRPLPDGRHRDRARGPEHRRRPVRLRRMRVERRPRRQPAGLELPARVLRVRAPRRRPRAGPGRDDRRRPRARAHRSSARRWPSCGGACGTAPAPPATPAD